MTGGKQRLLSCYPVQRWAGWIDARSVDVMLVAARRLSLIEVRRRHHRLCGGADPQSENQPQLTLKN